jgi:hypothetical protein
MTRPNSTRARGLLAAGVLGTTMLGAAGAAPAQTEAPAAGSASVAAPPSASRIAVTGKRLNVRVGRTAVVRGVLRPRQAQRIVRLDRLVRGRWRQIDGALTSRTGRFTLRYRTRSVDTSLVRVRFRGDGTARASSRVVGRLSAFRPALASWYGPGLYGNALGCGGRLSPGTIGVAHKSLPVRHHRRAAQRLARRPRAGDRPRPVRRRARVRPHRGDEAPARLRLGRDRLGRALARPADTGVRAPGPELPPQTPPGRLRRELTFVSRMARIAHLDVDAFYASVELLRRPELRGKPVIVSGSGPRAVVTTASYEARKFGIGSAMPTARARRLCPDAVLIPPDFTAYREASAKVMGLLRAHVERVEVLGLDEAYLDLDGLVAPRAAMRRLVAAIREETG